MQRSVVVLPQPDGPNRDTSIAVGDLEVDAAVDDFGSVLPP